MNTSRRDVKKLFELFNVHIRKDALDYLTDVTKDQTTDERKKYISNIIIRLRSELMTIQSLDLPTLKNLLLAQRKDLDQYSEDFHVVNMPTEFYHELNTKSNVLECVKRNGAEQLKKTNCLQRRMMNILSSLDRSHPTQQNIRPIEQLFSETVCHANILAIARRVSGESIIAEDLTAAIPIEFTGTKMEGWLPFEGGIFVFSGQQMDGIFTVDDVHLPVPKVHDQLPRLTKDDSFNREKFGECSENDKIVVLSDVWLDSEKVHTSLNNLFQHLSSNPPAAFILCGSFHSANVDINYLATEIENFRKLSRLINEYSATFSETKFVFVPSAEDLPSTPIVPKHQFLPVIQKVFGNNKNIIFATNPCKILYKNRVISVFRDNLVEKISRSSMCAHMQGIDVVQSFVDTIWSQRHFCPVLPSVSPVISHLDDCLLIQFDPDLLITADKFMPFVQIPEANTPGFPVINPGSFGVHSNRAMMYWPRSGRVELTDIPVPSQ